MSSPTLPANADAANKTPTPVQQPTNTNAPENAGTPPGMSRYEKCSLLVNTLGFVLIIGTLVATWVQLKQGNDQFSNGMQQRALDQVVILDRIFVEYPEIREYFYDDISIDKEHKHYQRVEAVAEMHLDLFSYVLKSKRSFPDHYPYPETTDVWMRQMLSTSPAMRRYLQKHKDWYPELIYLLPKGVQ